MEVNNRLLQRLMFEVKVAFRPFLLSDVQLINNDRKIQQLNRNNYNNREVRKH